MNSNSDVTSKTHNKYLALIWPFRSEKREDVEQMGMRSTLAAKLLGVGMIVAVISGVLMGGLQIVTDFNAEVREDKGLVDRILHVASSGAREAFLRSSPEMADNVIEPLMIYNFVAVAELVDDRGVTLSKAARAPKWNIGDQITGLISEPYTTFSMDIHDKESEKMLGQLSLTVHNASALADFYSRAIISVMVGVLRNMVLVAVLLMVFHRILTRPVAALVENLSKVDPRNPEPFEVPESINKQGSELTVIANTTNEILSANRTYIQEINDLQMQNDAVSDQLRHSERLSAIGQLVGGVAHDFNNILGVIQGVSDILEDETERGIKEDMLSTMRKALSQGSQLTSQLLAYSRKQPLIPEAIHPNALFDDLNQLLNRTIGQQYELCLFTAENVQACIADKQQLETVLMNLAINARDAMPDGGRIRIRAENVEIEDGTPHEVDLAAGRYIMFSVIDEGAGMSDYVKNRAFDPYFTTKPMGKGSGLGLSMAHGFALQSKGNIEIESISEVGTTIRLYLPLVSSEDVNVKQKVAACKAAGDFTGKKLIIVEDDPSLLRVIIMQVKRLGVVPITASNIDEALRVFAQNEDVKAALIDVVLPGDKKGTDLGQVFLAQRPNFKISYMSGYTHNAVLPENDNSSNSRLLQKPFNNAQLVAMLDEILNNK